MQVRGFIYLAVQFAVLCLASAAMAQPNGSGPAALARCVYREIESPMRGLLAADPDRVYVGADRGRLSALDADNLALVWRLETGGELGSEILVNGTGIFVVTSTYSEGSSSPETSTIRMVGKESGLTVWASKLPPSEVYRLGRLNGGVAAVGKDGQVTLLDAATGRVRWQSAPFGNLSAKPAFSSEKLILGTADKSLISVSALNGGVLLRQTLDFVPTAVSLAERGSILVGDERGQVSLLAAEGKPVWKFKSGAGVSSATEIEEGVLVTSLDNFVYLISDYNGDVIWKRRLPARLLEGGLSLHGHFIVLLYGENSGFVLDLKNGKLTDVLPPRDRDLANRTPVHVRSNLFAITTTAGVEIYALGGCGDKQ